jgi:hypothetical protein
MQTLLGTVHHLINAVNGLDPALPPVQALIALNKIKAQVEGSARAPEGKPPTVASQDVSGILSAINNAVAKRQPAMPQVVPQVTPPVEEPQAMAHGGITHLPSHFNFDHGGIVSFAKGTDDKGVEDDQPEMSYGEQMSRLGNALLNIPLSIIGAPGHGHGILSPFMSSTPSPQPARVRPVDPTATTNFKPYTPNAQENARLANIQANGIPTNTQAQPRPPVVPSAPQAPQAGIETVAPQVDAYNQFLINQMNEPVKAGPDYVARKTAFEELHPELKNPAMSGLETKLKDLEAQDAQARKEREKREAMRNVADFFHNLSMAGRASAGQTGIGALLGNYGNVSHQSAMEAFKRQEAYEQADRDHAIEMTKYQAEIEKARRAEARGDFKDQFEAEQKAAEHLQKAQANKIAAASSLASMASQERIHENTNLTNKEIARDRERMAMLMHTTPGAAQIQENKLIADYMARHGVGMAEAAMAIKSGVGAERNDIAALKTIVSDLTMPKSAREAALKRLQEIGGMGGGGGTRIDFNTGKPI